MAKEESMMKDPDQLSILRISVRGTEVQCEIERIEGIEPADPQAMIGALANAIAELNQYVFSHPVIEEDTFIPRSGKVND
jgi:hypothetical protein